MRRGFASALALVLATASILPAQGRSRLSVDLGLGGGDGYSTAPYRETSQMAAELTIAIRRNPDRQLTQLWGLAVGAHDDCLWLSCYEALELNGGVRVPGGLAPSSVLCLSGPYGAPCPPKFPSFTHVAALGGVERDGAITIRALAGPAFYGITHGASGAGAQARLDVAGGFSHLQLMIWGTTSQLYRFSGDRFTLMSFGLGVRVQ